MRVEKMVVKTLAIAGFFGSVTLMSAQTATSPAKEQSEKMTQVTQQQTNPEIEALKKKLEANPEDTQTMAQLVTKYQEAKDWNNALATTQKLSMLLPDWAPGYYSQGYLYQMLKDDAKAKTAYETFISKVKPEELEESKKNLSYAHLFVAHQIYQADKEKAKEHIAKSLEYDATNEDAKKLKEYLNQ